ncbi:hypothetical protein D1164_20220 [Mariniphaga sediminis]|uniref:Uncharacterized protein n=1 Tax=Mariniphaga sediminis TaxID=1628158 RepID=A0A399CVR4_9BACT|nr:hypothetical protein D1164_20220 [Mariniphaga sediminis]
MVFIRGNSKLLFVFILPVYFYIVQSSFQNKHTHFYPNGIVVTHSHPVDTENGHPINEHDHCKTEICFFHQLNFDYFIYTPELQVISDRPSLPVSFILFDELNSDFSFGRQPVNRGPPSVFSHSFNQLA